MQRRYPEAPGAFNGSLSLARAELEDPSTLYWTPHLGVWGVKKPGCKVQQSKFLLEASKTVFKPRKGWFYRR